MRVDRHNAIVSSVYSLQKVKRVGLQTIGWRDKHRPVVINVNNMCFGIVKIRVNILPGVTKSVLLNMDI